MAQKIVRLSEEVINQIAAGEVVENPASIVKELLENSLDAGAKRIEVAIEAGGQQLIQVEDDGCGMSREDALLSIQRHATSKIRSAEDLQALHTMGFRGEALAAIAAVSRFELRTFDGEGTKILAEAGQVAAVEPCARNRGTTLCVRSLFYNVPARKKFQKSRSTNTAQVVRTVETIALAYPEVAFSLSSNGERLLSLEAQEKRARIEALLGPFREVVKGESIWGLLAAPEEAKAQRRGQYVFINRRAIFSPLIGRAVQKGYGTRLAEGLYPSFVLFLEIPPSEVDVNVHPQKREVRFREEGKVFRSVEEAVAAAFPSIPTSPSPFSFIEPKTFPFSFQEEAPEQVAFPEPLPLSFAEKPLFVVSPFFFLEKEQLLLVDLRKAHARVLFESLQEKKGLNQALIWPLEILIEDEQLAEELQKVGIECRIIGRKKLAVDALPSHLEAADFPNFLTAWKEGRKLDRIANRFSHTRKKKYNLQEAMLLWKQLMHCRETEVDPLGSLIWKPIESSHLESLLK